MKKTSTITALLISTVVLSTASPAFAAPLGTNVTVQFKAEDENATGGGNTLDPTDPNGNGVKPSIPGDGNATKGPLRIDFAPNFKFGTVVMSGNAADYHPINLSLDMLDTAGAITSDKKVVPHYVQVTDNRGNNEGWVLKMSATAFKGTKNTELDLAATLTLKTNPKFATVVEGSFAPTTLASSIKLNETDQALITTGKNKGMGTWATSFGETPQTLLEADSRNSYVTLHVPANSKKDPNENYASTINWTLETTPTS